MGALLGESRAAADRAQAAADKFRGEAGCYPGKLPDLLLGRKDGNIGECWLEGWRAGGAGYLAERRPREAGRWRLVGACTPVAPACPAVLSCLLVEASRSPMPVADCCSRHAAAARSQEALDAANEQLAQRAAQHEALHAALEEASARLAVWLSKARAAAAAAAAAAASLLPLHAHAFFACHRLCLPQPTPRARPACTLRHAAQEAALEAAQAEVAALEARLLGSTSPDDAERRAEVFEALCAMDGQADGGSEEGSEEEGSADTAAAAGESGDAGAAEVRCWGLHGAGHLCLACPGPTAVCLITRLHPAPSRRSRCGGCAGASRSSAWWPRRCRCPAARAAWSAGRWVGGPGLHPAGTNLAWHCLVRFVTRMQKAGKGCSVACRGPPDLPGPPTCRRPQSAPAPGLDRASAGRLLRLETGQLGRAAAGQGLEVEVEVQGSRDVDVSGRWLAGLLSGLGGMLPLHGGNCGATCSVPAPDGPASGWRTPLANTPLLLLLSLYPGGGGGHAAGRGDR